MNQLSGRAFMGAANPRSRQGGGITLITALIFLVALSLITLAGSRVAMHEARVTANNARADTAFAVAEAGLQAAQQYLAANRSVMTSTATGGWLNNSSSVHWLTCSSGSTAPPCGDGSKNLYGTSWQYYGPVPNLPALPGEYQYQSWYLSQNLNSTPIHMPYTECQQLDLLNPGGTLPILNQVGALAGPLITQVNGLVSQATGIVNGVLNTLIGQPNILPNNLGVPTSLCLPINFTQMDAVPPPSRINPSVYVVSVGQSNSDAEGAHARLQAVLQPTSFFAHAPPAAIMVSGDANLVGDVRVWGNPRPPTRDPDFSTLNLDNLNPLGIPLTSLTQTTLGGVTGQLAPVVAPLLDPVLGDALKTDASTLLSLHTNVTFPLSIWAGGTVNLLPEPAQPAQVKTSQIGGVVGGLLDTLGLGGLANDLINAIGNLLNGLLGPILGTNPDPLVPNLGALLNSARTCLPQWPGDKTPAVTGAPRDACVPLSQTITVLQGMITPGAPATPGHCKGLINILGICLGTWVPATPGTNPMPPNNLSIPLKLPDVQDDSTTLQSIVTGLLNPGTTPVFPSDLFNYSFGVANSQATAKVKGASQVSSGCGGLNGSSSGLHWVTGGCSLSGDIGSEDAPVVLITQGNITLAPGTNVYGAVYLYGGGSKTVTGSGTADTRPTIRGALLADGTLQVTGPVNVVYDQYALRAAGFLSGSYAVLPGSWNDSWSGP